MSKAIHANRTSREEALVLWDRLGQKEQNALVHCDGRHTLEYIFKDILPSYSVSEIRKICIAGGISYLREPEWAAARILGYDKGLALKGESARSFLLRYFAASDEFHDIVPVTDWDTMLVHYTDKHMKLIYGVKDSLIKGRVPARQLHYSKGRHFFKTLGPEQLYIIGHLLSDGSISSPRKKNGNRTITLTVARKDREVLLNYTRIFGGKIYDFGSGEDANNKRVSKVTGEPLLYSSISISDQEIVNDLAPYIQHDKTYVNSFGIKKLCEFGLDTDIPEQFEIAKKRFAALLLGMFDGDGTVYHTEKTGFISVGANDNIILSEDCVLGNKGIGFVTMRRRALLEFKHYCEKYIEVDFAKEWMHNNAWHCSITDLRQIEKFGNFLKSAGLEHMRLKRKAIAFKALIEYGYNRGYKVLRRAA